jgi:hypothetical protein
MVDSTPASRSEPASRSDLASRSDAAILSVRELKTYFHLD